jgi:GTP-binding protein Era
MPNFCGYIALVGRPNVGKSTLLNRILDHKISITSRKPQTTRHSILGVRTDEAYQSIYVDTPGIHLGSKKMMNKMSQIYESNKCHLEKMMTKNLTLLN